MPIKTSGLKVLVCEEVYRSHEVIKHFRVNVSVCD